MADPAPFPFARDRFDPVPGGDRKIGIEIEFGGLTQARAAAVVVEVAGGHMDATEDGDVTVTGSRLGSVETYLDTALRKSMTGALAEAGLDLSRAVVPVEIVTEPVGQDLLPTVEALCSALAEAGATGTQDGILLGFGLHLNPAIADAEGADVPKTGFAFAYIEDWLRANDPLDISRRALPFTQRYPRGWLDALADAGPDIAPDRFFGLYGEHNSGRNRGLDLLPIYKHLFPDVFAERIGGDNAVSARPAYHYRMPDSRIGAPGWTLAYEWNRWAFVERAARDADFLESLGAAWRERVLGRGLLTEDWAAEVGDLIAASGLRAETAP